MIVRFGYVAMSQNLTNASPSQRMSYSQFEKIHDREAAVHKLERIARSNLHNCLRLLKHNLAYHIRFFRMSSRLIPLAGHEELSEWNYIRPVDNELAEIGDFAKEHKMRLDFHPEHFVVLNLANEDVLKRSIQTLRYHKRLLRGMGIKPTNRCVMHVGGKYKNKVSALEKFIENWMLVPASLQRTVILENDDKLFHVEDVLFLCEKLEIPLVFDLHHHLVNSNSEVTELDWDRIVSTWRHSPLPIKIHVSSPKSETQPKKHADDIEPRPLVNFLRQIKGTVSQLDCMIEAKAKDNALFQLMDDLSSYSDFMKIDGASFHVKS